MTKESSSPMEQLQAGWDRDLVRGQLSRLYDRDAMVRVAAAEALGRMGPAAAAHGGLQALLSCLTDGDDRVRCAVVESLAFMESPRVAIALRDLLRREESVAVRLSTILALGQIAEESTIPALITCLEDDSAGIRLAAADALGAMNATKAAVPLAERLSMEADSDVCDSIVTALGAIGSSSIVDELEKYCGRSKSDPLLSTIVEELRSKQEAQRWCASPECLVAAEHLFRGHASDQEEMLHGVPISYRKAGEWKKTRTAGVLGFKVTEKRLFLLLRPAETVPPMHIPTVTFVDDQRRPLFETPVEQKPNGDLRVDTALSPGMPHYEEIQGWKKAQSGDRMPCGILLRDLSESNE